MSGGFRGLWHFGLDKCGYLTYTEGLIPVERIVRVMFSLGKCTVEGRGEPLVCPAGALLAPYNSMNSDCSADRAIFRHKNLLKFSLQLLVFLELSSPGWTRTSDPLINSQLLYAQNS